MTIDIEKHNNKNLCADKNNHFFILTDYNCPNKDISKQYLHFST